jgi:hypothetical protein
MTIVLVSTNTIESRNIKFSESLNPKVSISKDIFDNDKYIGEDINKLFTEEKLTNNELDTTVTNATATNDKETTPFTPFIPDTFQELQNELKTTETKLNSIDRELT